MKYKENIIFSIKWFFRTLFLFNFFNCLMFLVFTKINDWELFSYNFFGSFIIYSLSFLIYFILSLFLNFIISNFVFKLLTLLLLVDFVSLLIAEKSMILTIFTNMIKDKNYILIFYPLSIFISLITFNKKPPPFHKGILDK